MFTNACSSSIPPRSPAISTTPTSRFARILEKNNAEVLVSRLWDERQLTYPIKNQKKGIYYLTYFSSEGKNLVPIEHDCALNEMILRQLILKIHPKMVETMLSLAKGEHAVALHNMQEEPSRRRRRPVGRRTGGGEAGRREPSRMTGDSEQYCGRFRVGDFQPDCRLDHRQAGQPDLRRVLMANLNKVMLIGRLTRDPEVRMFANGGKVATFGFAVNNRRKNQQTGQWEDEPVFIDVEAFNRGETGKTADLVEQYLHKGNQAFIEGHLKLDQWEDKNGGGKRSKLKVVVDNVQFLEPRTDGGSAAGAAPLRAARTRPPPPRPAITIRAAIRGRRWNRRRRGQANEKFRSDLPLAALRSRQAVDVISDWISMANHENAIRSSRASTAACSWC